MTQARIRTVQCLSPSGLHRLAYKDWGDPANPDILVCVHGLTRVSDDFDALAQALCGTHRVICPDVVGRGRSGWLRDPQHYHIPQYLSDMVTLLARVSAEAEQPNIAWLGTSMGGLIGMALAALPENPVRKLILNDVGTVLEPSGLARIREYVGTDSAFPSFEQAAARVRAISQSFGPHSDEQWRKIAADVLRQDASGQWGLHYDPKLALPLQEVTPEIEQRTAAWLAMVYGAITCPTLLVRGAESDLLSRATAQAMTQGGPKARLVEIAGVGHAPTFVQPDQIDIVKEFLAA